MDNNSIRNRILQERKRLGLTQDEMGNKIGVSGNAYRDIEKGKTRLISNRLEKIAAVCGKSVEEIILGYPAPNEDFKSRLEESEKEFRRKITEIEADFKLTIAEKDGEINVLRTTLSNKEKIIGLLKENKSDY